MIPTLFVTASQAKQYLAQNKDRRVLVLNADPDIVLTPRLKWLPLGPHEKSSRHEVATFSFFGFKDFDLVRTALAVDPRNDAGWSDLASIFVDELIALARSAVAEEESIYFSAALKRVGFDLSFESFLKCAFDKDGNIRFFRQTLSRLKIDTVERANVEMNQERYQYITMQFVSVWAEHQARIGSHLLIDLNAPTLSEYDALIMVTDENRYTPFLWRKDAAVLLELAVNTPH